MTIVEAKKRAMVRRKRAILGDIRRGPHGVVIMDYAKAVDSGDIPDIFVTNVSRIEKIGPGTIRLTYFVRDEDGDRVVNKVVWDLQEWLAAQDVFLEARVLIENLPIDDGPKRKDAH